AFATTAAAAFLVQPGEPGVPEVGGRVGARACPWRRGAGGHDLQEGRGGQNAAAPAEARAAGAGAGHAVRQQGLHGLPAVHAAEAARGPRACGAAAADAGAVDAGAAAAPGGAPVAAD
ncbi:unnamed protein product, partial [Prorocentrum cordatum]